MGGHFLPIAPSHLSWRVRCSLGHSFRFVELADDVNAHMPDDAVRRLVLALNRERTPLNGSRVLLLGRGLHARHRRRPRVRAAALVQRLLALGAQVRAADPHVVEEHVDRRGVRVEPTPDELAAADAVVPVTDHDAFDYEAVAAHPRLVLDTRHRLTGPRVEHL